ncbi:hypothetical protein AB8O64_36280 (plasmid) [Streptomyces sp. QH1-20]|uniref:hypothetical protein n=1 Tax=Streptomyces sp. QH1-20 TaxID=3240934 RepID=UPI003514B23E
MAEICKRCDAEFRAGVVRYSQETGKPIAQVARDLGVTRTRRHMVSPEKEVSRAGLDPDERAELARLCKENLELRMERDVPAIGGPVGQGGDDVRGADFIADHRASHQVPHAVSCRALEVSRSWFYKWLRRPPPGRGSEYTSKLFGGACDRLGLAQSMGRVGSAVDNAVAEAVNSTIKVEYVHRHRHRFRARAEVSAKIATWITD